MFQRKASESPSVRSVSDPKQETKGRKRCDENDETKMSPTEDGDYEDEVMKKSLKRYYN